MEKENISPMDAAISKVESTFDSTANKRSLLIDKLMNVVNQIDIVPGDESPKVTEQKLSLINALDNLLKSSEANAINAAKVQMQKKDTESSSAAKEIVIEMLKNLNIKHVNPNTPVSIPSNIDTLVEVAVEKTDHTIEDTELEENN